MTTSSTSVGADLPQERRLVTAIPGPKSQALQARRVAAVSAGVGATCRSTSRPPVVA